MAEQKIQFFYVADKTKLTDAWKNAHQGAIVFIEDTHEIWAKGHLYSSTENFSYVKGISANGKELAAGGRDAIIPITAADGVVVDVTDDKKLKISLGANVIATGTENGTIAFNGANVPVKGLGTAAYKAEGDFVASGTYATDKSTLEGAIQDAQDTADGKVASIAAGDGIAVDATTATAPKVSVKIATGENAGNVTLTATADGLKAAVTMPTEQLDGVKEGDKVLSMDGTKVLSALKLNYVEGTKKLQILGVGDAVVHEIDATAFVKDGMISEDATNFNPETKILTIGFNTDGPDGVKTFDIDLTSLVDTYTGANLKLTAAAATLPDTYSAPAKDDTVDAAMAKLAKGVADAKASGVTSLGGKTGALTIKTETGDNKVQLAISDAGELSATGTFATVEQGGKADSAVQNVTAAGAGHLTLEAAAKDTNGAIAISGSLATATLEGTTDGLVTAADARTYVTGKANGALADAKTYTDTALTWIEIP